MGYEAVYGTVERPGLLKVNKKAWANNGGSGAIFFDASTDEGGTVTLAGQHGTELVHKLPDGVEQRWRVLEWDFDPFTPRSSKGKVADDSDSSDDSASEEPSKTKKKKKKSKAAVTDSDSGDSSSDDSADRDRRRKKDKKSSAKKKK